MYQKIKLNIKFFIVILTLTLSNQIPPTLGETSLQSSNHHKHRHKHQIFTIDSNQIHDIREAYYEYRNVVNKDGFEKIMPLRHHNKKQRHHQQTHETNNGIEEDETMPAIHQHQHGHHAMNRQKRINGPTKYTSTTTTTTTAKTIDANYDDEYDDDESDTNRKVNDDAHVQMKSTQIGSSNHPSNDESLTSYKMKTLGTRDDVDRSFQEMKKNSQDLWSHVMKNMIRTKTDGLCQWPTKKVVDTPQYPLKSYVPRKYVIYRCSDDTSCCGTSEKTCVAKKYEDLDYYFRVRYFNKTESFERIKVRNDTECECIYKSHRSSPTSQPLLPNFWTMTTRRSRIHFSQATTTTSRALTCKCPQSFDSVISTDGNCECLCDRSAIECQLKYEGKEGFTISEQRCIESRECTQPHCLYGTYKMTNGRCPDRNDKIRGFSRHHPNHHQRL